MTSTALMPAMTSDTIKSPTGQCKNDSSSDSVASTSRPTNVAT